MFVVTGDETGLVKLVDVKNRTYLRYGDEQSRSLSISGIVPVGNNRVISVHLNGSIDSYTLNTEGDSADLQLERSSSTKMINPVGLERIVQNGAFTDKVLLYNAQGSVSVYNTSSNVASMVDFTVKGPLCSSATCDGGQVLFGGKENDAKLYSLETQKELWAAKNVSQDKLHLRVPVWNTCLAFRDSLSDTFAGSDAPTETTQSNSGIFYSGTAYRHVRMYDMKASQQPVVTFELGADYRVTAIQPAKGSDSERFLYVADTAGFLTQWDMRMQRRLHTLKGAAGSIRRMALSSDGQELACVGLDRFLRTYDTSTNKMTSAVYLKNRLNTCLFVGDSRSASSKAEKASSKKKSSAGKSDKGKSKRKVANEEDEDLLQELGAGDSSDEGSDEGSDSEGEGDEGSDESDGVQVSGSEADSNEGEDEGEDEDSDGEGGQSDDDDEGSEVEMDSADDEEEDEEEDEEGSDSSDEGSASEEEEEEVVVPVAVAKGKGKSQRPASAAAQISQPKKARR